MKPNPERLIRALEVIADRPAHYELSESDILACEDAAEWIEAANAKLDEIAEQASKPYTFRGALAPDGEPAPAAHAPEDGKRHFRTSYDESVPGDARFQVWEELPQMQMRLHAQWSGTSLDDCLRQMRAAVPPSALTVEQEAEILRQVWGVFTTAWSAASEPNREAWLRVATRARSLRSPDGAKGGVTEAMRWAINLWDADGWMYGPSNALGGNAGWTEPKRNMVKQALRDLAALDSGASVVVDDPRFESTVRRVAPRFCKVRMPRLRSYEVSGESTAWKAGYNDAITETTASIRSQGFAVEESK